MKRARLKLRFFLDEGVPVSTGKALETAGHEVIYFDKSGTAKGSADTMVCLAAQINDAILVAHDGDMRTLARGHGLTQARFRTLNLLKLDCRESEGAARVKVAMSLIEHEWRKGSREERHLHVEIGTSVIRTHR